MSYIKTKFTNLTALIQTIGLGMYLLPMFFRCIRKSLIQEGIGGIDTLITSKKGGVRIWLQLIRSSGKE